jgi:hypothetical protein
MALVKAKRSPLREPCCHSLKEAYPLLTDATSRSLFCESRTWFEYLWARSPHSDQEVC